MHLVIQNHISGGQKRTRLLRIRQRSENELASVVAGEHHGARNALQLRFIGSRAELCHNECAGQVQPLDGHASRAAVHEIRKRWGARVLGAAPASVAAESELMLCCESSEFMLFEMQSMKGRPIHASTLHSPHVVTQNTDIDHGLTVAALQLLAL